MRYLAHVRELPSLDHMTDEEKQQVDKRFDANDFELNFDGNAVEWGLIDEMEIVPAARQNTPAGWLVKNLLFRGERYHIGVYFGREEMILTNITEEIARFIAQTIAYYARQEVRYKGVEDVAPLADEGT